jgi:type VI secretion system Hcp family effector
MKKSTFLFVFILACNFVVAQDYFIKFDGIEGKSYSETHQGWSDIESFNQELGSTSSTGTTTGMIIPNRTGRTSSLGKSISIVKKIDKSSPKIMESCINGRRISMVEMEISISGNVILRYELRNVTVTKYIVMGNESNLPTEEITISFEQQRVRYTEYDNKGIPKGTIETEYN